MIPHPGLNRYDLLLVAVYLAGITAFGISFRKRQRGLRDYFLADRAIPWWAIAVSIVAAETSTLTVISIPGLAYAGDMGFLQVVLGYLVGRVIIAWLLLPHYFRGELFTAYQLIERRFGPTLHKLTAGLFLVLRSAAEGVRVWAVAIVVGIAIGTGDVASVAIVMLLTLIYTYEGGLAAVIWTDVIQTAIYLGGTLVGVFTLLHLVPGGAHQVMSVAAGAGKLRVFDFTFSLKTPYTFWAGLLGGTFLVTATHGTDQLIVQRLLAAKNEAQSRLALLSSGVVIFFQFALFLLVGAMLFVFYRQPGNAAPQGSADHIFPTFIARELPHGIAGLMIAAILAAAMSNLSAALNSLSSSSMIDFYLAGKRELSDAQRLWLGRVFTLVWGAVLFALAFASRQSGHVVEVGLAIASVAFGALLGVFLLGVLTKRASERGTAIGMLAGLATNIFVATRTSVPWTLYVMIGTFVTMTVGYILSLALPQREATHG